MRKPKISTLKKKVWKAFSIYIRKKYCDTWGYNTCYTCGKKKPYKQMQAGHGFSGRHNSILFEEDIVRPQCYGCNVMNAGKLHIFTHKLREELGEGKFEFLYKQQFQSVKFTVEELEEKLGWYQIHGGY